MAIIDLTGRKFGRLEVIEYAGKNHRNEAVWRCKCDCGKIVDVRSEPLRTGHTKSCGCYRSELDKAKIGKPFVYKHLQRNTRLYSTWCNMKSRCNNKNNTYFSYYGGRGIFVCKEWNDDFSAFAEWAQNNGYSDDLTIDRIDTNGNYEPSNCRFVDMKVQGNNKRNNRIIPYEGKEYTLSELSDKFNLDRGCLGWRLDNGWELEKALKTKSAKVK